MFDAVSASINQEFRSETNSFARATGKSAYEMVTGKKPNPARHFAKMALAGAGNVAMFVGTIALSTAAQELGLSGTSLVGSLVDKGGDKIIKGVVSSLGRSSNPAAHAVIRVSSEVINTLSRSILA